MIILKFGYEDFIEDDEPLQLHFDKENNKCSVYYTYLVTDNNTFAIVKNEIVLQKDMNAIFIYKDGLIHSTINKIDFDKKRLKIGKVYLSEKSDIMAVGVNNLYTLPGLNDNEEDEGDFYG